MDNNEIQLSWRGSNEVRSPIQVTVVHQSARLPFVLRNFSSDVYTYNQIFVNQEYNFSVASPPEIIVDAGANIGLTSIYFANKFPDAKIIAIEPEESNFSLLVGNSEPYKNIIPVQAALWDENGLVDLVDPKSGHWGFMTSRCSDQNNAQDSYRNKVTAMTVDKIMESYDLNAIDILKMDIEGAEKEVFSDSSAWIGKVRALIIELHDYIKPGCSRSFYNGSNGFDREWYLGENIFLTRDQYLIKADPDL